MRARPNVSTYHQNNNNITTTTIALVNLKSEIQENLTLRTWVLLLSRVITLMTKNPAHDCWKLTDTSFSGKKLFRLKCLTRESKFLLYKRMTLTILMYCLEAWVLNTDHRICTESEPPNPYEIIQPRKSLRATSMAEEEDLILIETERSSLLRQA